RTGDGAGSAEGLADWFPSFAKEGNSQEATMPDPKVLSQEVVFKGRLVQVRVDRVVEPAGHTATREIVVHPGAVCIVARPAPDEVILIRQYRHAAGKELLEIPAGGLNNGEDPLAAAIRELEEETGYRANSMIERE